MVFGVIFGGVLLLGLYNYVKFHFRSDLLAPVLLSILLYPAFMATLEYLRISVGDDGIVIKRWFASDQYIPFSSIEHSDVQILAERDWPLKITIHTHDGSSIGLGMKTIRQEDAMWFCSLHQLKCRTHPGLTRRA